MIVAQMYKPMNWSKYVIIQQNYADGQIWKASSLGWGEGWGEGESPEAISGQSSVLGSPP